MNNRSMRYAKLMKAMGMPEEKEPLKKVTAERAQVTPERFESITGAAHPVLDEKRRMQMMIDAKISQLEESDDPNALESLNYWKQKQKELGDS